jgi:hypothetical protein
MREAILTFELGDWIVSLPTILDLFGFEHSDVDIAPTASYSWPQELAAFCAGCALAMRSGSQAISFGNRVGVVHFRLTCHE